MAQAFKPSTYKWLHCGTEIFPALAAAIDDAKKSIRLEVYIYTNGELGVSFRDALVRARQRDIRVQVLIDTLGSSTLPASFWDLLTQAGGEVRWFNPVISKRFGYRDHRKICVCDEEVAFIGGFNIGQEYNGDGVNSGWFDLGLRLTGPLAVQLAAAFDEMYAQSGMQSSGVLSAHKPISKRDVAIEEGQLLLTGPGRGRNPFTRALRRDLSSARIVQIICPYFLPTWRIRRALINIARRGGKVQILLPAKSDVTLSQLAGRSLYRRLLRAGIEIYEYQPQILHAKLILVDDVVYAGSSNLDPRSLCINYELMLRFQKEMITTEARKIFTTTLKFCKRIELESWRKSRTAWSKLKQRWAYFLLVRMDPMIVQWENRKARKRAVKNPGLQRLKK